MIAPARHEEVEDARIFTDGLLRTPRALEATSVQEPISEKPVPGQAAGTLENKAKR